MPAGFVVRGAVFLSYLAWCAVVLWAVGDAVRHNDRAAYINGGLQIVQGEMLPWRATLFNYDKEFGSYWLIAAVLRISGFWSVVLSPITPRQLRSASALVPLSFIDFGAFLFL